MHRCEICTKNPTHKPHPRPFTILLTDAPLALPLSESPRALSVRLVRKPARSLARSEPRSRASLCKGKINDKGSRHCQSRPFKHRGFGLGPASRCSLLLSDPFCFHGFSFLSSFIVFARSRPRTPRSASVPCLAWKSKIFHEGKPQVSDFLIPLAFPHLSGLSFGWRIPGALDFGVAPVSQVRHMPFLSCRYGISELVMV